MAKPIEGRAWTWLFKMVDETDGLTPETGLTVTAQISKDGASFAGITGSPSISEIGVGWYKVTVPAADMVSGIILKATATGAAQTDEAIYPETPLSIAGAVDDATVTPSTTQFAGDSALSSTDGQYSGTDAMVLIFTSGALKGLGRRIDDYVGATRSFAFVDPWPAAPADGDTFELIGVVREVAT